MIYLLTLFGQRWVLLSLLLINFLGTIYGYWWYKDQLAITPPEFLLFVPDSPTASLFFVLVLIFFLIKRRWPLMEAFAAITLIKYGIWAVVMNLAAGAAGSQLYWQHYMLIASHLGMAVQAVLYAPYYRIKPWHIIVVTLWTLHNDVIDYVFLMHPWVSQSLTSDISQIGYFTFWLSVFSIATVYFLGCQKNRLKLDLQ